MAVRSRHTQDEHDAVVAASAQTYGNWRAEGHEVATNPNGNKNRRVGSPDNPRYPDVIVWKPERPGSGTGTALVIEEIETADSVNEAEAVQWSEYARLGVKQFILVVPAASKQRAAEIATRKGINGITKIQGYYFNNGHVQFE